jgi:hypothetical protein
MTVHPDGVITQQNSSRKVMDAFANNTTYIKYSLAALVFDERKNIFVITKAESN